MIRHYVKFALRNFKSNKIVFGGSLLTICLGTLCISMLALFLWNELTQNDFHKQEKDIFMTVLKSSPESQWEVMMPTSYFGFDHKEYPEIKSATNLLKYNEGELGIGLESKTQYPAGIVVDSTFFDIFDFELKVGDKKTILHDSDAIIISENLAEKLFGLEDPIGKKVTINTYMKDEKVVRGILTKIPSNSSLQFDFILPNSYFPNQFGGSGVGFFLMNTNSNVVAFNEKIKNLAGDYPEFEGSNFKVIPFESTHFNKYGVDFKKVFSNQGDTKTMYILFIILAVIFSITTMNISNLQIINTNTSVKYIVLSVINGAQKRHVIYQKLTELGLIILISILITTVAQQLLLPEFNGLTKVVLDPSLIQMLFFNIAIVLLLTFLAMLYPVAIALKIPIIKSLKNQTFFNSKLVGKKNVLILQYTLTFILLMSSMVVVKQLHMMLKSDLGFNSKNIVKTTLFKNIPVPIDLIGRHSEEVKKDPEKLRQRQSKLDAYSALRSSQELKYDVIKNEMIANASIISFSQGNSPTDVYPSPWKPHSSTLEYIMHNTLTVKPNHKEIFGFKLKEGRFFEAGKDEAYSKKIVINEAAKEYWGVQNIRDSRVINQYRFETNADGLSVNESYEIIGVVENFNYERLSKKVEPLVMVYYDKDKQDEFLIQLQEGATLSGLTFIENLFNEINPNQPFSYSFVSDEIAIMYEKEKQLGTLYGIFTILALIISTIGLFTIALYDTQRRVKEIGIRKVNGAKAYEILAMLNKDFSRYVLVAFLIASPIAYILMQKWLENFAYKTTISWWIFVLAGVFILLLALLTVSWHSYKAANTNPVDCLRTE